MQSIENRSIVIGRFEHSMGIHRMEKNGIFMFEIDQPKSTIRAYLLSRNGIRILTKYDENQMNDWMIVSIFMESVMSRMNQKNEQKSNET